MMRDQGARVMEYLHATLFFAMFVPLVYAVAQWSDPAGTGMLYLKCLMIAVPVIVTERAARRGRSVVLYVLISLLLLAGMGGVTGGGIAFLSGERGVFESYQICYCAVLLAETFFVIVKRFADRVKAAKRKREDPLASRYISFLEHPTLSLVWYFVVFYLFGFLLNSELLCDISFYSAIAYTFLALLYEYFCGTRAYLEMNKRTKGIPRRRLYGVSFSMLLIYATLLFGGMLPAVLLAGQRQYTDIREWFGDVKPIPYEYDADYGFRPPAAAGGADWMELLNDGEPAPHESPAEIEENAGLGNDDQMQHLHRQYEEVRYGRTQ